MRIPTHLRFGGEVAGASVQGRMAPVRGDLRQGPHDEQPLMRPRMRQDQFGRLEARTTDGDQIQIQGSSRIRARAPAAEIPFYILQQKKDPFRRPVRIDNDDCIEIIRKRWIRPGSRPPKVRDRFNPQTPVCERRHRRVQQIFGTRKITGEVRAQRYDHCFIDLFLISI